MSGRSARSKGLDLEYRPPSYWETPGPIAAVRSAIKGQNRRQLFTDFVAGELGPEVEQLEPELLAESLDEGTRRMLGRLHPHWMGGEYLPSALPGEVEIARIVLQSVTQDVISIRARRRRSGRRIFYRIVDDYGDDPERGAWRCRPAGPPSRATVWRAGQGAGTLAALCMLAAGTGAAVVMLRYGSRGV